jgi:hypothetical protein
MPLMWALPLRSLNTGSTKSKRITSACTRHSAHFDRHRETMKDRSCPMARFCITSADQNSIANRLMLEVGQMASRIPSFPLESGIIGPLRANSKPRGSTDLKTAVRSGCSSRAPLHAGARVSSLGRWVPKRWRDCELGLKQFTALSQGVCNVSPPITSK